MESSHRRRPRGHREDRANRIVGISVAALLALTAIVVAALALQPASTPAPTPVASTKRATPPIASNPATPAAESTRAVATTGTATVISKPSVRKPAAPKPPPKNTVPDQMRHLLPGSSQIIVVTGAKLVSKSGNLSVYNLDGGRWVRVLSTAANFGDAGLTDGKTRQEGRLQTPTGIWWIGGFLFGQHGSAPSGTRMPYRHITDNSWWSDRRDSSYNTWVESGSHVSGEHLADATVQYEYAFDSGYNSPPNERVVGRGTAIFIHCFEPPGNSLGPYTHGCVAISRAAMLEVFGLLDPKRRPYCVIGTAAKGTSTSVYAY